MGREAVCGNAICEVGELLPVQASGSIGQPCLADCPVEVIGCPQNDAGDICSGTLPISPGLKKRLCSGIFLREKNCFSGHFFSSF